MTKLDRLARSLPDAREVVDDPTRRQVKLSLGGSCHDPVDPLGRLLINVLALVADFALLSGRPTGRAAARCWGRSCCCQPCCPLHDNVMGQPAIISA